MAGAFGGADQAAGCGLPLLDLLDQLARAGVSVSEVAGSTNFMCLGNGGE
jgi:hypothetical protein